MNAQRLFIAIDLPDKIAESLAALDPHYRGLIFSPPSQIHLTLAFFAAVDPETANLLKEKLTAISFRAFFLPVIGLGTFSRKGISHILWLGVGHGHPHLFQLHKRVQEAALAAGLEPDLRAFHPHITLARCRDVSAESLRPFLRAHAGFDAGMIHVESFFLNSSELTSAGSVYKRELALPAHK